MTRCPFRTLPAALSVALLGAVFGTPVGAAPPSLADEPATSAAARGSSYAGWFAPLRFGEPTTSAVTVRAPRISCPATDDGRLVVAAGLSGVDVDASAVALGEITAACEGNEPVVSAGAAITGRPDSSRLTLRPGEQVLIRSSVTRQRSRVTITVLRTEEVLRRTGPGFGVSGASLRVYAGSTSFAPIAFTGAKVERRPLGDRRTTRQVQRARGDVVAAPTRFSADGRRTTVLDRR